jgi:hypothetical protein
LRVAQIGFLSWFFHFAAVLLVKVIVEVCYVGDYFVCCATSFYV